MGKTKETDDVLETVEEFIEQRRRDIADLGRKAEKLAQDYYGASLRAGGRALEQRQDQLASTNRLGRGTQVQNPRAMPAGTVSGR